MNKIFSAFIILTLLMFNFTPLCYAEQDGQKTAKFFNFKKNNQKK